MILLYPFFLVVSNTYILPLHKLCILCRYLNLSAENIMQGSPCICNPPPKGRGLIASLQTIKLINVNLDIYIFILGYFLVVCIGFLFLYGLCVSLKLIPLSLFSLSMLSILYSCSCFSGFVFTPTS